jgi:ABC-type branched-subunit amino acid transport system substrate-binding protein
LYGTKHIDALLSLVAWSFSGMCASLPAQTTEVGAQLRIGVISASASHGEATASAAVLSGVKLGAAEAKQTAKLFGSDVDLYETGGASTSGAVQAATSLVSRRHIQVLVGAVASDADALSRFAETNGILFLNAASREQSLRSACRRNTFHIEASEAMYANARRSGRADPVVLWDASLQRFGASQLNDRYRTMFKSGMGGSAWSGWAAVKVAAEAALRARSADPGRLRAFLEAPGTQFDGHKGWPLSFRRADHQLRQPLYIVVARTQTHGVAQSFDPRDIPDLRTLARSGRAAADVLDQLVAGTGAHCSWPAR